MSSLAFALTKIQPPRLRSALIERPELEHHLGEALASARLTLLSAPAGYGKTAALTRQLSLLPAGTAAAWVALDEDDDLARVAACLVAALEPCDPPWRSSPEALIVAMQDGTRASRLAFATALVNALADTDVPRGLILLDDVHRISDPAVFEFFDLVIERLPPHWGVVMASRNDPPLALARLRASGDCVELRQDDLGFTADDVRALMQQRHADSSEAAVRAVHERTQGWPAGLGLVLSESPQRRPSQAGSLRDRHVFDYLASEVLDDMPPALRQFLLRCSVLPELTAARCAVVSGDPQAAHWLDEIERRGLFASVLESDVFTLRLHDLFRDCLDDRLRRESPDALRELLLRAAETEDDAVRRIGYLLRAGEWARAEAQLTALVPDLLIRGDIQLLLRLHDQFPEEQRQQSPRLRLARCIAAWAQWDWAPMRESAMAAVETYARLGDEPMRQRALSYACVAYSSTDEEPIAQRHVDALLAGPLEPDTLCRTLLVDCALALPTNPARTAVSWARLVDTLEGIDELQFWYECTPIPTYIGQPGMRAALSRYVAGVVRRLPEQPIPLSGMIQITQGWLHMWAGRWREVDDTIAAADADCRWLSRPTNLHWQLLMLRAMRCALRGDAAGNRAAMQTLVDEALALVDTTQRIAYLARVTIYAQRMAVIAGDLDHARELSAKLDAHRHDPEWYLPHHFRLVADAYAAQIAGRLDEARRCWEALLPVESQADVYGQAVEVRLRLAETLVQAGQLGAATQVLAPVFARLSDEGDAGMALTAGPQVLATLAHAPWGERLAAEHQHSLRRWAQAMQSLRGSAPERATAPASHKASSTGAPPHDLLTQRELEVLQRIAAGDSNKLIARAFDLSPHTVKRHVANILDKLGVDTRGQAAAWARQHG